MQLLLARPARFSRVYLKGINMLARHLCAFAIKAEKTLSYGCSGHGENQCKIALFVDGKEICPSAHNACSKSMIVMKDRSRVIVRPGQKSGELICQFG